MTFTDALRRLFQRPLALAAIVACGICMTVGLDSATRARKIGFGVAAIVLLRLTVWLLRRG